MKSASALGGIEIESILSLIVRLIVVLFVALATGHSNYTACLSPAGWRLS